MWRASLVPGAGRCLDVARVGLAGSSILLLAGCAGPQSALEIRGPAAERIAGIWWAMLAIGVVIYLVVVVLVLYLLVRRQGSDARAAGVSGAPTRVAKRWVLLGGIALPVVVLAPLFVASVRTLSALMHETESDLTVHVTGHQWWWQVAYEGANKTNDVLAANEIHIPVGRRVRIELVTADVIHSLWIPNLHGKTDLVPGRTNVMWIEATRPGISRAQCAEYCGTQHAHMALPVVAETQADFDDWLARERLPALLPLDSVAREGAGVFMSAGCWSCHAIRGTAAAGTRGPDLTHMASRRTIAAGTLTNTRANLGRWITDPQAIKPGNKMPRAPLTSDQLTAVVAYLGTLR
jgi:cytochrome c oxidase subunit 2